MLLTNSVKTKSADWCRSGTNASVSTMIATPITCHQTLTSLSFATRPTPKVLMAPCSTRMIPNSRIVCQARLSKLNCRSRYALRKNAAPKSMPAVTATWPRKLNQPVNQDHAAALVLASLADQ